MKKHKFIPFLLFGLLLSSCISTMKIKVDAIDRTQLMASGEVMLIQILQASEVEKAHISNDYYDRQKNTIITSFRKVIDGLVSREKLSEEYRDNVFLPFEQGMIEVYRAIQLELNEAIGITQTLFLQPEEDEEYSEEQIASIFLAKSKYANAQKQLNETLIQSKHIIIQWDIDDVDQDFSKLVEESIEIVEKAQKDIYEIDHLDVLHDGLFDDPLNSVVLKNKDNKKYWKKIYNKALARNFMGNSDIAVVMERPGNFFIKGVRMDAEEVTKTLASSFDYGVKLLAKVNGIAVPSNAADTSAYEKQLLLKNTAISQINAILLHKDSLISDTGYQNALEQIKRSYPVYKEQLEYIKQQ